MTGLEHSIEQLVRRVVREEVRAAIAELAGGRGDEPRHVTVAAFAKARSLGISTVREMIRDGRLPAVKIGRAVRVRADAAIGEPARAAAAGESDAQWALRVHAGGRR